ncbi:MAG: VCBS repeat-containing protein [Planctomycetes bacterium]|nr:VCBS repeat-containing protein [Planctomycetota bacterium]
MESALTASPREIKAEDSTAADVPALAFSFAPAATYSAGPEAANLFDLAAGDLDGDGSPDLATANLDSDNLTVFKNDGAGAFTVLAALPAGKKPRVIAIADLNQDGRNDLIAANWRSSDLSVLFNQGSGAFTEVRQGLGFYPFAFAVADLDGDKDLDLAAANFASSNVSVRLDDGSGKFAEPVHFETGQGSTFVLAADLDQDGDVDLAAANQLESSISVLLNDGTAQFARTNHTVGPMPLAVAAADLDGDQNLDLAAPNYDANNISVLRGKGDGTFAAQVKFTVGDKPSFVQPLDADGDRDLDLAVANSRGRSISILKNPGTGAIAFNAPVTVKIGGNPNYLAAADLDGDGDPDLAAANWGLFGGELNVLLLWNDGSGSFSTSNLLNEGYDSNCLAVADLNGDGRPDLAVSNFFHESVGVFSIPVDQNPILDMNGAVCHEGQSGKVFFLSGAGTTEPVTRACAVRPGTPLFFPLINAECSTVEPPPFFGGNAAELSDCAGSFFSAGDALSCAIDGVALQGLERFRAQSPVFEFSMPAENNLLGLPGVTSGLSVSDGYWLLLAPLRRGEHTIHFTAALASGPMQGFSQDVTYHLRVE